MALLCSPDGAIVAHKRMTTKATKTLDRINLRLAPEVFSLVDRARAKRLGSVSRNTWIAEAIQEKLSRELEGGAERVENTLGRG